MTPPETLMAALEKMRDANRVAERRNQFNTAMRALRQILEAAPPADAKEAEARGYQAGMLAALELAREAREALEKPLRKADVADAYTVINGVLNYGQALVRNFESLATGHLMTRIKERT